MKSINRTDAKWYFAYGSNLNRDRLRKRIAEWKQEQRAILRDYELTFAKGYEGHTSGKANIMSSSNREVKGAIYLITEDQFGKLDTMEGVEKGVYKRMPVSVESEGELKPAITYVMCREICLLSPSKDYLDLILKGLQEHGYSERTIEEVKEIANVYHRFLDCRL